MKIVATSLHSEGPERRKYTVTIENATEYVVDRLNLLRVVTEEGDTHYINLSQCVVVSITKS